LIDTVKGEIGRELGIDFSLERPKDLSFGHYATPVAFSLAKQFKKSPIVIADDLCSKFNSSLYFEKVESIKGYINFTLSDYFLNNLSNISLNNEDKFATQNRNESLLLEYVSANPTGPLHIGHSRGAVYGNTLYNIATHLGIEVDSEYYVNDAGNQIELLGVSIFLAGVKEYLNQKPTYPNDYYKGDYILDLALEAKNEFGISIFENRDNIEKLSNWGKIKMLNLINKNLKDAKIEFDSFVSEREIFSLWDDIEKLLIKNGATYNKDGKIWLKSSNFGDEKDRVIVREDGRPTYLAGDIIYHNQKFIRNYDHYINIWGADHHGYIARVKASIKFLGYDDNKLEIILSQMVSLLSGGKPYKMSKRSGNFILMSDIVSEIGSDALRFIFLTKKSDTHLEFDIDDLKKQDSSNPIYYINYAHARVNQIFQKSGKTKEDIIDTELKQLNKESKKLLFYALSLGDILNDIYDSRQLQKLSEYLKSLASLTHQFYNKYRILDSEDESKYLKVLLVVALSIRTGLKLMGIEAKYRM
jgi:arginyl-tRNA synthetase